MLNIMYINMSICRNVFFLSYAYVITGFFKRPAIDAIEIRRVVFRPSREL